MVLYQLKVVLQLTSNQQVGGSSPPGIAILNQCFYYFFYHFVKNKEYEHETTGLSLVLSGEHLA